MSRWNPEQEWEGEDAYIVGGGPSLRDFDFNVLRDRNVIGCNSALALGGDICNIIFFGDARWGDTFYDELARFPGRVVTNSPRYWGFQKESFISTMQRKPSGLHKDALGWNFNSGASAINLALILGARRVFLLGFDCQLGPNDRIHWHDLAIERPKPQVYQNFRNGFQAVARALPAVFPGCKVINLNLNSTIDAFPKMDRDAHFSR